MAIWQVWELVSLLEEAVTNGIVLSGVGAGPNCWFDYCLPDARADVLGPLKCFGLRPGRCCPHYSTGAARKSTFEHLSGTGALPSSTAIDNGVAVHFEEGKATKVVSSTDKATAYAVGLTPERTTPKRSKVQNVSP